MPGKRIYWELLGILVSKEILQLGRKGRRKVLAKTAMPEGVQVTSREKATRRPMLRS